MRSLKLFSFLMSLVLLLAACGGAEPAPKEEAAPAAPAGDAKAGETLFNSPTISSANLAGCATCHSLEAEVKLVGPSLHGIGTRAGETVAGKSAEDYIRESITTPNAHVVEGFTENLMPQDYGKNLSEDELNNLVAFLMTK